MSLNKNDYEEKVNRWRQDRLVMWRNLAIDLTKPCTINRGDSCDHCAAWVTVRAEQIND